MKIKSKQFIKYLLYVLPVIISIIIFCLFKCNYYNKIMEHLDNIEPDPVILNDDPTGTDIMKYIDSILPSAVENYGKNGPKGEQGERGEPGPKGNDGGTFLYHGVLRNAQYPKYVADRASGSGIHSIAYLNKQNHRPSQSWTLQSSQILSNKYGECLVNNDDDLVYMEDCPDTDKDDIPMSYKWIYDQNGRLMSKRSTESDPMCLTVQNKILNTDTRSLYDEDNNGSLSVKAVNLVNCNDNLDQKWTFY